MLSQFPPAFVLGCPRSGTTLMGGMLEPTAWGEAVETHFITKYAASGAKLDLTQQQDFSKLCRQIIVERPIQQWKIDWDLDELFHGCHPKTYSSLVNAICMQRSKRLGVPGWADKTPHFSFNVPLLKELFDDARFIFIFRDGRDVAHSLLHREWGPNNVWACADYWQRCCAALLEAQSLLAESQLLSLRYEDLLESPEETLVRIYEFMQVDDAVGMAHTMSRRVRTGNSGHWRDNLSPRQVRLFERVSGDMLNRLGYATTHPQQAIPRWARESYRAGDALKWAAFMFKQNVIDGIRIRYLGAEPFAD